MGFRRTPLMSRRHKRSAAALEATAFHEAGHAIAAWHAGLEIHSATIVPTPSLDGCVTHANPLYGVRLDYDGSDEARLRAEAAIVVLLAGPAAQRRHNPRSWRSWHGASDHERAVDLATSLNSSDRAVSAHLAWLAILASDQVDSLWDLVERVARELVERHTMSGAEIAACCASQTAVTPSEPAEHANGARRPPAALSETPGGRSEASQR
jgi:hypothetical protein